MTDNPDRSRLVNLMYAIHRLEPEWSRRPKAEVATWHHDSVDALRWLVMALPKVHKKGSAALQQRTYAEIQKLANQLMQEKRWQSD